MKKLNKLLIAAAITLTSAASAFAGICGISNKCCDECSLFHDPYLAPKIGASFQMPIEHGTLETKYDPGVTGSLAMGMHVWQCFRFEVEGTYSYNKVKNVNIEGGSPSTVDASGHMRHLMLMFNGYFDYYFNECFSAYLGVGAGMDFYNRSVASDALGNAVITNNVWAYQIMPGIAYALTESIDVTLGYRLIVTDKQKNSSGADSKDNGLSHNAELGLRIKL